jgi:threonine synthase
MQFNYVCSQCGKNYAIDPHLMVCPRCTRQQAVDQPLAGILEVALKGQAAPDFDIHELLPVERRYFPPIPVGNTPLWRPQRLRKSLGFTALYIKDDGANPTSSFKDRASFLVSAMAKKFGIDQIVLASTGNAGSSMAGVGAAAGQTVTLFLPKDAPPAKLIQALQYGSTVHRVDGSYDMAYDLSMAYARRKQAMSRNTAHNPMTIEGKKSVSLELYHQLDGTAPDYLFVATGDGCILSGVYKGFRDLKQVGLITRMPVVFSVQAKGSDALYRAFQNGRFEKRPTQTIADSICVAVPRNGLHALAQLKRFGGEVVTVSDERIIAAQAQLSSSTGLFTEPAGAAAFAGLLKVKADLAEDATIVILATGNGLKDSPAASKGIRIPEGTIRSIEEIR